MGATSSHWKSEATSRSETGPHRFAKIGMIITVYVVGKKRLPFDFIFQATCENPEGIRQLALEYARAGADVTQTFTINSTDDQLPDTCKNTARNIC